MKFTLNILFLSIVSYAQQNGQSSLYFFNQSFYNPAYIAVNEGISFTSTVRNQWVNFKGAPKTSNLTVYSSIGNSLAGGLSIQVDQLGAMRNSSFFGDFSYKIRFSKKKNPYLIKVLKTPKKKKEYSYFAFGISLGVNYYQTLFGNLKVIDNTDEIYTDGINYSQATTNVGAGMLYYNTNVFFGMSVPTLIKNKLGGATSQVATEKRHVYVVGGFVKELKNEVIVRPSFVLKVVENAPISIDLGLSFLFQQRLWLGVMLRGKAAIGANIVYTTKSSLRLGYAYDYMLNSIQRFSSGSHEVMIGYNVNRSKKKSVFVCPKF